MEAQFVRANGFERPFHPLQIVSWVVFGLDVVSFCIFGIPLIETVGAKVLVALCYASSVAVLVLAAIRATGTDPSDPHIRQQDWKLQEKNVGPYCTTCNSPVFARSKHCRACNKCIKVFDHHCMWLNNCVGDVNYRAFGIAIASVAVMTGIVLHICIYLFVDCLVNEADFKGRLDDNPIFGGIPKEAAQAILAVMIFINLPLFFLDMQLIILHMFLSWHQLTTYEYIMEKKTVESLEGEDAVATNKRVLPRCLDWIVYRSRRKKRPKQNDNIEQIEPPRGALSPDPETTSETSSSRGHRRHVDSTPSPPGSTTDFGGVAEHGGSAAARNGGKAAA
jgi:palmitoyltransferase